VGYRIDHRLFPLLKIALPSSVEQSFALSVTVTVAPGRQQATTLALKRIGSLFEVRQTNRDPPPG
jgi:hypothetical protein